MDRMPMNSHYFFLGVKDGSSPYHKRAASAAPSRIASFVEPSF